MNTVRPRTTSAIVEQLERRVLMSAGDLDPTFGEGDGMVLADLPSSPFIQGVATDDAGGILVAASTFRTDGADIIRGFSVTRFLTDGSLDVNFGNDGTVTHELFGGTDRRIAFARQGDGKLLVAGTLIKSTFVPGVEPDTDFALARLNGDDGSLDATFGGGDGWVSTEFTPGSDLALALLPLPGGAVLVAGGASNGAASNVFTPATDLALARYDAAGNLDPSFGGGDGRVVTPTGANTVAIALAAGPGGSSYVAAMTGESPSAADRAAGELIRGEWGDDPGTLLAVARMLLEHGDGNKLCNRRALSAATKAAEIGGESEAAAKLLMARAYAAEGDKKKAAELAAEARGF